MIKRHPGMLAVLLSAMIAAGLMSGCGGGGGGGGRGTAAPAPDSAAPKPTGEATGLILIATENGGRLAPRPADPFMSKIPANTNQKLDVPASGYVPITGVQVSAKVGGVITVIQVNTSGVWNMALVPAGATELIIKGNGKQATVPITIAAGKQNKHLTLITEDAQGNWLVEGQLIHGDGTDGYKKETHADATSDTVFESGVRDHHKVDEVTDRDTNDDGIVDQRFSDPNDDGTPDGPVTLQGGEPAAPAASASTVNNAPPAITSVDSKDSKGKNKDTVTAGDSLKLDMGVKDTDGGGLTPNWKVLDAAGNDVTSQFISAPDTIAPTFSPPQGDFSKPGAYEVIATVTDPQGATDQKDFILTVDSPGNASPHASIKANHTAGDAPLTVDMTCDAFDKDGSVVSYCWDFDKSNGVVQTNGCDDDRPSVTKTFIAAGKYRVTCIVTDDKGATGFARRVIVVHKKNSPPDIVTLTPAKTTVAPGEKVKISMSVQDPDGDSFTVTASPSGGSVVVAPSFTSMDWTAPQAPGEYVIEVTATDNNGASTDKTVKIRVDSPTNHPPTVKATATPASGAAPLDVALSAVASDPDAADTNLTITWDFDDSDAAKIDASGATAQVKYGAAGERTATVTVCDPRGACATDKVKIVVSQPNRPPFISGCSASASSVEIGKPVALSVQSSDPDNNDLTTTWTVTGGALSSATEGMPDWTAPTTAGEYKATVRVSDGVAPAVTCEATITVVEPPDRHPLPPASCNATGGNGSAILQWVGSLSENVDHYRVTRRRDGDAPATIGASIAKTARLFDDSGLTNGETYYYQVIAVSADGLESVACEKDMQAVPQGEIDKILPIGRQPSDALLDPPSKHIFVPSEGDDDVSVIDEETGKVIGKIPVGDKPVDVCSNGNGGSVYAVNNGGNSLSEIDPVKLTVISTIPVGNKPESCEVNRDNGDIYVGDQGDNKMIIVDPVTKLPRITYPIGSQPTVCAVNEAAKELYLTDRVDGKFTIWDLVANAVKKSIPVGRQPEGCGFNDKTGEAYVPNLLDGDISVIDVVVGRVKQKIQTGGNPACTCAVNKKSNQIYITNRSTNTMILINGATKQIDRTIRVGTEPVAACVNSDTNKLCSANRGGDSVSIISNPLPNVVVDPWPPLAPETCDASAKTGQVALDWTAVTADDLAGYSVLRGTSAGGPFQEIAATLHDTQYVDTGVTDATKYFYQILAKDVNGNAGPACSQDATPESAVCEVIDTGGQGASAIAQDETRNIIYIANEVSNTVSVINRSTFQLIRTINLPPAPAGTCCGDIEANKTTNKIYITNKVSNKLTVINGTDYTIEETIDLGGGGGGTGGGKCAVNETTNEVFITNETANEIYKYNANTKTVTTKVIGSGGTTAPCHCDIAADKTTNKVYVTNKTTNKVTVINSDDMTVEETIDIAAAGGGSTGPGGAAFNEVTKKLYMTNEETNEVTVLNTRTKKVTKRISVGVSPKCTPCGVNTTGNQIYVPNKGSNSISLIDGSTDTVVRTLPIGHNPLGAVFDFADNRIYALNGDDENVSVINNPLSATPSDVTAPTAPSSVITVSGDASVSLAWATSTESDFSFYNIYRKPSTSADFGAPLTTATTPSFTDPAATAGTTFTYAVAAVDNAGNESVKSSLLKGRTGPSTRISVGGFPANIAVSETLGRAFVTNRDSDSVSIISSATNAVVGTVETGSMPWGIGFDPVSGKVFVANQGGFDVTVFDGATGGSVVSALTGGALNSGIAIDDIHSAYYVSTSNMFAPSVIPMELADNTAGSPIATRSGSVGIGVNRLTQKVYVANALDDSISVINAVTGLVVATIASDSIPTDVVVNESNNKIYVTCGGTGRVMVIDGASDTLLLKIAVGLEPVGMGLDTTRGLVYVANSASGTVSVIDSATDTVVGLITVGDDPSDVGVLTGSNKIFVALKTPNIVISRSGF